MQLINADIITYGFELLGACAVWAGVTIITKSIEKLENLFTHKGEEHELTTI